MKTTVQTLDPWHYTGNKLYHNRQELEKYEKLFLEKLPEITLPIAVGWTGYIDQLSPIDVPTFGKTKDEIGRNVFVIGEYLLFQRYVQGNVYMFGKLNCGSFSDQVLKENFEMFVNLVPQ